jgi:hypothetical protein
VPFLLLLVVAGLLWCVCGWCPARLEPLSPTPSDTTTAHTLPHSPFFLTAPSHNARARARQNTSTPTTNTNKQNKNKPTKKSDDARAKYAALHVAKAGTAERNGGANVDYLAGLLAAAGGAYFAGGGAPTVADFCAWEILDLHLRVFKAEIAKEVCVS